MESNSNDEASSGPCRAVEAYHLDVGAGCFSSKETLSDVCLREETKNTSGEGDPVCLVSPDGDVYYVARYGYTQHLEGEDWNVFDIDNQVTVEPNEHVDDPLPPACLVGREALNSARERCFNQNEHTYDVACETPGVFRPALEGELMCPRDAVAADAGGHNQPDAGP